MNECREEDDQKDFVNDNIIEPHAELPKPEPPPGIRFSPPARSRGVSDVVPSTVKTFFKEGLSFLARKGDGDGDGSNPEVIQFDVSDVKVIVREKNRDAPLNGRISFFSRSNCRDCTAVRSYFREEGLPFVEINIDVFPKREEELVARTGSAEVPCIFLNGKIFGRLVALNSMRNSGDFHRRAREILDDSSVDDAPAPPAYGLDDEEEPIKDSLVEFVRVLRQKLPIQDRLLKMKIVHSCFSGDEMIDFLVLNLGLDEKKAVDVAQELTRKHFIHNVFGTRGFETGNQFYRFLEHEKFISKCHNFRGVTNDEEPKAAEVVASKLHKIMSAIVEAYTSDDRRHVFHDAVARSEEFRRYINLVDDLQRVNLLKLSHVEKLSFFLNLYNAMVIHAVIRTGFRKGLMDRRSFYSDFQYVVGGAAYSLGAIKNGILRGNRRSPYSLVKPLGANDRRLELAFPDVNPLIHFGLCNGTRSSPTVRFFTRHGAEAELRQAAREFFQRDGVEVDLETRTIHLSRILSWFSSDFGKEREMVKWVLGYLDGTKAGLLTHLMSDGGPIHVIYQEYDWSVNSYPL